MRYTSSLKQKLIYVFRINDMAHLGCLKIGEATSEEENLWGLEPNSSILNRAAKKRINQYTQTAGISYELLYTELAVYGKNGFLNAFSDTEVHNVLLRSGVKRKTFDTINKANEWFVTDLETAKKAISAVKEGKDSLLPGQISQNQNPIVFRPEQKAAIIKTKKQFKKGNEMLWFAKMRFGKTLSALQVVKEHEFVRTLILTHRPVVDKGWFEDFGKIFYDSEHYSYGSKNQGGHFSTLEKQCKKDNSRYIYFASMQDLRGSELVGGCFDKNDMIFKTPWDFIIIDEAHEGTQTHLGKNVISELKKENTKILHLSGTPFNLIDDYKEEEIYTWDYVMEQKAKAEWDSLHFGDPNPYASLPKMNIFTFDLGKLLDAYIDEEVAFNFKEFFRVDELGNFIHNEDVFSFLNLICKRDDESNYPFANQGYRDNFRHSLWMVPGVKEARALSKLLKSHPVFSHFDIVNVAGTGDEEESNEEALKKVEKAISDRPHETYTITLSCGRLTTGVSVKAWTAVFMLSGSYSTSASSYMQTIFRVQTPATINGKIKKECFVFDFAPDRTLKVIAETAKVSAKAGKTTSEDRKIMGEFLNYCPIISADGTQMREYNVSRMLEQLKRAYIERVVNNGFEDSNLYNNDQLMKLGSIDLEEFEGLKKIIGSTKAMPKSGEIDVNRQGFTDEEYEKLEATKKKKKSELTEEEKRLLEERKKKKKNRDTAISILRGISIRMPLLIYGADIVNEEKELTIDNFTDLIDNQSWEEFMPKGVSKKTFLKFKKYYEPDVFRAAGKRIRALTRATDKVTIEERIERLTAIFSKFKNPDKETVLTPWKVVNMHIGDCLGGYLFYDEEFESVLAEPRYVTQGKVTTSVYNTESKILEINSKSGLYPLFLTYGFYRRLIALKFPGIKFNQLTIDEQQSSWDEALVKNVFIVCKTPMAKSITKRTLTGFREAKVNSHHFENLVNQISNKPLNFINKMKKGHSYWKSNNDNDMKFNAIVGNPPYMEMDGGAQASAKPIYNQFVEIAKKIQPDFISMIMPTRWYSGGKGLDEFRDNMLNDEHIAMLHDFLNPDQVFPRTNIRGGVCYFLWDRNYNNVESLTKVVTHQLNKDDVSILRSLKTNNVDVFIRHHTAVNILRKVIESPKFAPFDHHISSRKPFGLDGAFIKSPKFHSSKEGLKRPLSCFGRGKVTGYVEEELIKNNVSLIKKTKVFAPYANNIGTELNDDNLNSFVGLPGTICTESFIVIGAELELDKNTAIYVTKYLSTRFLRFMLSLLKSSQHATSKTYKFVPLQDFTKKSDIDWNKSIEEIDNQLYLKYNLTSEEIEFVESMIKSMK